MNSTKLPLVIVILLYMTNATTAQTTQNVIKNNDAKFVVGIETILTMYKNNFTQSMLNGVVVEKPLGQFSVGLGLHFAESSEFTGYRFTGHEYVSNEPAQTHGRRIDYVTALNVYQAQEADIGYLNISAEVKYRLPCNCFFAYTNIRKAQAVGVNEVATYRTTTEETLDYDGVTRSNYSVGYGLGVNLHILKRFRGVFKFGNEHSASRVQQRRYPISSNNQRTKDFQISFGLQYGISGSVQKEESLGFMG